MGDRPVGEGRLGLGVDDEQRDVQLLPDPADEPGAVFRFAHRGGRDRRDAVHVAALADLAHAPQGLDGAVHRRFVEAAGARQPRGEPRLILELVDDGEAGGGIVLGHQQAHGVRAYVDRGDPLPLGGGCHPPVFAGVAHAVTLASPRSSA
jgi:hypothetical protein